MVAGKGLTRSRLTFRCTIFGLTRMLKMASLCDYPKVSHAPLGAILKMGRFSRTGDS